MAVRADDVDLLRDRSLVERIQGGDLEGFEDLYRRYFQRLYRFCLRRVGDPHEAEELAQEAFTRAFRAMPTLAGERRFYPWLSVIAARLCVDTHRRSARTEPSADIDLGAVEGGQDAVFDEVDRLLLVQALSQLGPRHREVLRLREEEGWSYQSIASHLDVSLGTVEALLFRARKALRREFEKVAGVDTGLAGLPVIGGLIRRFHWARLRIAAINAEGFGPLVGNAFAAAAVVTGVAGFGLGPGRAGPAPTAAVSPIVASQSAPSAHSLETSPTIAVGSGALVGGAHQTTLAPGQAPRPGVGGATLQRGAGQAQGYSQQAPVGGNAGPLSGGFDPKTMAQDTATAAKNLVTGKVTK